MGRYAGWIALHAGVAGTADVILIPEIPYTIDSVAAKIRSRFATRKKERPAGLPGSDHVLITSLREGSEGEDRAAVEILDLASGQRSPLLENVTAPTRPSLP